MHSSAAIALAAALALAGQASARTPPVDGPVSTAPVSGGGAPLSTQQQIDQYLAPTPAVNGLRDGDAASDADDRRIHGEVSVAVGSGGYRAGSVSAVIPIGEAATLALSVGKSMGGYGYFGQNRPGYAYDSLSAPQAIGDGCGASRPGQAPYSQPRSPASSPAPAQHCAER